MRRHTRCQDNNATTVCWTPGRALEEMFSGCGTLLAVVSRTAMRPSTLIFQVEDDGKGWVWLAAEMSPGGLAVELFKSVPYGTLG